MNLRKILSVVLCSALVVPSLFSSMKVNASGQVYRMTKMTCVDQTGAVMWTETYTYDEKGYQTGSNEFDAVGNLTGYTMTERNAQNLQTAYRGYDSAGNINYQYIYDYNQNGDMTLYLRYEGLNLVSEGHYDYMYDPEGRVYIEYGSFTENGFGQSNWEKMYHYQNDGTLLAITSNDWITNYQYDPVTKSLIAIYSGIVGGEQQLDTSYTYDANNNCTFMSYYQDGIMTGSSKMDYDVDGNLIYECYTDSNGNAWQYFYDYTLINIQ